MATFRIHDEIKGLLRPLTPKEYAALKAQIELQGPKRDSLTVADVRGDLILADGHHTYEICVALKIKLPEPRTIKFPDLDSVKDWVIEHQAARRSMTEEALEYERQKRRERVAEARQQGQSIRAIAEAEQVSTTTVQRDIEAAGVTGVTPEPPSGQVTGQDGKTYPATTPAPSLFCRACRTGGPKKNCKDCAAMRGETSKNGAGKKASKPAGPRLSDNGETGFELREFNEACGRIIPHLDKALKLHCERHASGRFKGAPVETEEYTAFRDRLKQFMADVKAWADRQKSAAKESAK